MQLVIAALGHKMPAWVQNGFEEYAKCMPPECRLVLREINPVLRTGESGAATAMAQEAARIEAVLPKGARLVVLDEHGQDLTSVALSKRFEYWLQDGRDVVLAIGGTDRLDPAFKARADEKIRVSSLTLPHDMVRVLLAEALYRAFTLTRNHPYHRA